jgi:hypothetical protein
VVIPNGQKGGNMVETLALPRRRGRIEYRHRASGQIWGHEDWTITRGLDGLRILNVHCEMRFGDEHVVRDSILSVHSDFHPHDAYVRIMNQGIVTGTGWFRFTDTSAECESWTAREGRISQTVPIQRPLRGFGIHAVQGDAWLAASFPYERGAGHTHFWGKNLIHSLHHFGATGPSIHTSESGFELVGDECVTVAAGIFNCHRLRFAGMTNDHPPYDMWVTKDGDFLYVKGVVDGYMDSIFELTELDGEPL